MTCVCGRIRIGMTVTDQRNWNPDCEQHGLGSDWYRSPEQETRRAAQRDRLIALQAQARQARKGSRNHSG